MNHANTGPFSNPRPVPQRRGIALMLVMIALVVTTILVGAALTTRENSSAIAENAATSVEAAWSAESAANFAVGAIAQSADLDALLGGDAMMSEDLTIFGECVTVSVTNLAGEAATDADRELIVTATSEFGGIEKVVRKRVTRNISVDLSVAVDPFLDEFAIYAVNSLTIESNASVGVWDRSPEAASQGVAKIGIGFSNVSDLDIDASVELSKVGLFCDEQASIALETEISGMGASRTWVMPLTLPVTPAGAPNGFDALPNLGSNIDMDGLNSTLETGARYGEVRVRNNGKLIIDEANANMYHFEALRIESGGVVEIRGNVHIKVNSEIRLDDGYLTLAQGASICIYAGDTLKLQSRSKFGVSTSDIGTAAGTVETYVAPSRVRVLALDASVGGSSAPPWEIRNQAVAVACLHNPAGMLTIDSGTCLFGRATAKEVTIRSSGRVMYCPALDSRQGFSEPTSPIYDEDGEPVDGLEDVFETTTSTPQTHDSFLNALVQELEDAVIDITGGSQSSGGTQSTTILDLPGIIRF